MLYCWFAAFWVLLIRWFVTMLLLLHNVVLVGLLWGVCLLRVCFIVGYALVIVALC